MEKPQRIGNWKSARTATRIVVSPFERLTKRQVALMDAEAESLGSFLETEIELRLERD